MRTIDIELTEHEVELLNSALDDAIRMAKEYQKSIREEEGAEAERIAAEGLGALMNLQDRFISRLPSLLRFQA